MIPVVTFFGWHNSGKTTLLRKVIREIRSRGYRVGIIKTTKHEALEFDKPGSDTFLYRNDGIEPVVLVAPDQVVMFSGGSNAPLQDLAFRLFPDCHLVIGEGFKQARGVPKIEVAREEVSTDLLRDRLSNVVAVVTDFEVEGDNVFGFEDYREIADFLEQEYLTPSDADEGEVILLVDGRRIPLNNFVRNSLKETVLGYIRTLKFTERATEVELRIKESQPSGRTASPGEPDNKVL